MKVVIHDPLEIAEKGEKVLNLLQEISDSPEQQYMILKFLVTFVEESQKIRMPKSEEEKLRRLIRELLK